MLLPTTSVLKRRESPATVSSFSVSATATAVSFASILLLLLLLRRDMHFCFLVEVLLLPIIFLVGCAPAAAGACAAYNIGTEAERGNGYCVFLLRVRCYYFPPSPSPLLLLSFASILLLLLLMRRDMHFCFLVEVCCC